ncbi:MAG: PepSY-associated TM helix domain-containing protein [Verrucomicrobia bacterium]|nr:PepSY-associated TM helix domain-containing protein [Verrucomicrobiota bacterium]
MIRKIHLLLALFLTPWVLMYAMSSIAMQHRELFYGSKNRVAPDYKMVEEVTYQQNQIEGLDSEAAGLKILKDLDLEGAHRTRGTIESGQIEITRDRPIGAYRIIWSAETEKVTVEKQEFGMTNFLEMLHRRRGFNQPFWANDVWAVIVDFVIVAILAWAFTGLWMWWKMKPTHKLGTLSMILGSMLFAFFIFTI